MSGLLSGLQINQIPEPSVLLLAAVGLLALAFFGWRRRVESARLTPAFAPVRRPRRLHDADRS